MKTLVLVSHPEYDNSMTEAFLKQSQSNIDSVDWVVLDQIQNQFTFDKDAEQKRLKQYDRILFQFPMYWYSAPALMKKYQLSALKSTLSEDKQLQMEVLIDYIQGNIDQLDELKWEIELIKKEDDE